MIASAVLQSLLAVGIFFLLLMLCASREFSLEKVWPPPASGRRSSFSSGRSCSASEKSRFRPLHDCRFYGRLQSIHIRRSRSFHRKEGRPLWTTLTETEPSPAHFILNYTKDTTCPLPARRLCPFVVFRPVPCAF